MTSIPQARVVRKAGQVMAVPPPLPRSDDDDDGPSTLRTALAYAIGLWPLTCVVLLVFAFLILAGNAASP